MKNLKIKEISSFGQKQGENMKIGKFPWESGRLGSYEKGIRLFQSNIFEKLILKESNVIYLNIPFNITLFLKKA